MRHVSNDYNYDILSNNLYANDMFYFQIENRSK